MISTPAYISFIWKCRNRPRKARGCGSAAENKKAVNVREKGNRKNVLSVACFLFFLAFVMWPHGAYSASGKAEDPPASVSRAVNRAYDLLEKDRVTEAVAYLQSYIEKDRVHYLIHFALGNCHMQAEKYRDAAEQYRYALQSAPDYAPAWFNLAKSRYELGEYGKAAELFTTAYDRSAEKNAATLYYAGSCYLAARQHEKALEVFDRLMAAHKEEATLDWKAAKIHALLALNRNREALPLIEELAKTSTGTERKQWQETLLYHYITLDMHDKALAFAEYLTREDPMECKWWKGLAHFHLNRGGYREALVALTIYSHLTTPGVKEKKRIADVAAAAGIPAQSNEILIDVLSKYWDPDLVVSVVRNYMALHQPENALKWVEKGIERADEKKNSELLMLRGEILFMQKDYAGASAVFRKLTRLGTSTGRPWLMLGYAAWNREDVDTAYTAMLEAKKYPEQRRQAEEALKVLSNIRQDSEQ
ncbi:MAG: tetratricopeptide repeat protein [Desulfobacterales bacterium]